MRAVFVQLGEKPCRCLCPQLLVLWSKQTCPLPHQGNKPRQDTPSSSLPLLLSRTLLPGPHFLELTSTEWGLDWQASRPPRPQVSLSVSEMGSDNWPQQDVKRPFEWGPAELKRAAATTPELAPNPSPHYILLISGPEGSPAAGWIHCSFPRCSREMPSSLCSLSKQFNSVWMSSYTCPCYYS